MRYLRVQAVEGCAVCLTDHDGKIVVGRFCGRDRRTADGDLGAIRVDGERVPDSSHYRRALARGELVLLSEEDGQ